MEAFTANGMNAITSLGPMAVGIIIILVVVLIFKLSFKLVWNGILGAICLWLVNFIGGMIGFGMKITLIKALIAGFFGIPGVVAIVLFEIFGK